MEKTDAPEIKIGEAEVSLSVTYPDGSRVQLAMPKPIALNGLGADQAHDLVIRLARRLLGVAAEDLGRPV